MFKSIIKVVKTNAVLVKLQSLAVILILLAAFLPINQKQNSILKEKTSFVHPLADYKAKLAKLNTADSEKLLAIRRKVTKRLEEISLVAGSIKGMGLVGKEELEISDEAESLENIGGAEIYCSMLSDCSHDLSTEIELDLEEVSKDKLLIDSTEELIILLSQYEELVFNSPLYAPVDAKINSGFGMRYSPFTKRRAFHQGADFSMPRGSEILAPADGLVKKVQWTKGYGLLLEVEHNNQLVTRYAHLSKALVKTGEKVSKDQKIALVGSTGYSTGPHLHYEVLVNNKPINPRKLIELGDLVSAVF